MTMVERFAQWLAAPIRRNRIARRIKAVDGFCYPNYDAAVGKVCELRIFGNSIVDWVKVVADRSAK